MREHFFARATEYLTGGDRTLFRQECHQVERWREEKILAHHRQARRLSHYFFYFYTRSTDSHGTFFSSICILAARASYCHRRHPGGVAAAVVPRVHGAELDYAIALL